MSLKNYENYNEEQIQVLEGLEAVRKRPGMYIGSTSLRGLHHLVYEIIDNSIDESLAGSCDHITVIINQDNSITNIDNGRGIPTGIHPQLGIPTIEVVHTVLHAGGKFGGDGYKVSGGLHGVGAAVVNALSKWMEVEVKRDGKIYKQRYEKGVPVTKVEVIGNCDIDDTGTKTTFYPDDEIFDEVRFDFDILLKRFREMAFLNSHITITLIDKREEEEKEITLHYEGGISSFVEYINKNKEKIHPEVIFLRLKKMMLASGCNAVYNSFSENVFSYANNIATTEGGTM